MADDQQMPVATDAVAEPAAVPAPEEQVAAPASDATPEEPAPQTDAASEPTPDPDHDIRAELDELRKRLEAEQPKLEEYQLWQQQQAEAARRAQVEEAQRRFDEQISDISRRVLAVDTEEEGKKLLADFTRRLLTGVQQSTQQQIAQLQQQHEERYRELDAKYEREFYDFNRPGFADKVIREYGLPDVEEVRNTLMQAAHPNDMPAIAQAIHAILAQAQPQVQQQVAQQHAEQRRATNADAIGGIGGGPLQREPIKPMRADSRESLDMLGRILGQ